MNPPSLAELREAAQFRLRDFERKIPTAEIDAELNRQLDLWTRDNSVVQVSIIENIVADKNPIELNPPPGYQVGRALVAIIRKSGQTVVRLKIKSPEEMYSFCPDWPNTNIASSTPSHLIWDFDPTEANQILSGSVWLWPAPNETISAGLVLTCPAVTDGLLKSDGDQVPALARHCKEELLEGACAALLFRRKDELGNYHGNLAQKEASKGRRAAYGERTARSGTRVCWL